MLNSHDAEDARVAFSTFVLKAERFVQAHRPNIRSKHLQFDSTESDCGTTVQRGLHKPAANAASAIWPDHAHPELTHVLEPLMRLPHDVAPSHHSTL